MTATSKENHPLEPFIPENARILMLGSFPPSRERWSMEFFYPNFSNDMWRIMGGIFFNDIHRFADRDNKCFRKEDIKDFCLSRGIALYDTATSVIRLRNNASDKYLEIMEKTDIEDLLSRMPACRTVVTTGQKASETAASVLGCGIPPVGGHVLFNNGTVSGRLYRMPSSSRAYPMKIEKKMEYYAAMFREIGILQL